MAAESAAFSPDVIETLLRIAELGAVRLRAGTIINAARPRFNVHTDDRWDRWEATLRAVRWLDLADGEYLLCLYDGWREYSCYVPPERRRYVPWKEIPEGLRGGFAGVGVAGEPRFMHHPAHPEIYPVLPRPVLAFARHRDDHTVILMPDSEFISTGGYAGFVEQARAAGTELGRPSGRMKGQTTKKGFLAPPLFWRGSANVDPRTFGKEGFGHRSWFVAIAEKERAQRAALGARVAGTARVLDAAMVPWKGPKVSLAQQIAASPLLLDLDGMVGAWSARFWKLAAESVVPVRPHTPWEQWFETRLIPWKHYVPILEEADRQTESGADAWKQAETGAGEEKEADEADRARAIRRFYAYYDMRLPSWNAIRKARQWCLDHPDECDRIAANGAALARDIFAAHRALFK